MRPIIESLKVHGWVAGFALAAALALCLPAFLMPLQRDFYRRHFPDHFSRWTNDGSFSMLDGFHMAEDIYPYAARVQHAGTHALPGDPYIRENRSTRLTARDLIPFYALGRLYRIIGDMPATWAAAQFLFALLWVPCLYLLMRAMGAEAGLALFVAVVSTLFEDMTRLLVGQSVLGMLRDAAQYLVWILGSYQYWLGPTRFTRPLVTYPCLFAAGLLFIRADRKRSAAAVLAGGCAGGALAYVHPDVWAAYVGAAVLFTAFSCWKEKSWPKPLLASLGVAAAVSAPWLWINGSWSQDLDVIGRQLGRTPEWSSFLYLAAAAACWKKMRSHRAALWLGCLLAAMFLALNSQVVLGMKSNSSHWFYLGNTFAALLLAARWLEKLSLKRETWLWLAACAVLASLPRALSYSVLHYKLYALPAAEEEAYRWLKEKTPLDSVVCALSPMTNSRLPVHTHGKTLVSLIHPLHSDISPAENAERLVSALELYGAGIRSFVKEGMDSSGRWERRLWVGEVDAESRERSGTLQRYFCMMDAGRLVPMLEETAKDPARVRYSADYLWLGPFEKKLARPALKPGWSKVFENLAVTIYAPPRGG